MSANGNGTVLIGCKWPSGLTLHLWTGGTDSPRQRRLLGPSHSHNYGETRIDRLFWDSWYRQHADSEVVKSRTVFEITADKG